MELEKMTKRNRNGEARILLATDGIVIDIAERPLTITYDLPTDTTICKDQIGHRGAYERKFPVINFAVNYEKYRLQQIEEHRGIHMEELPIDALYIDKGLCAQIFSSPDKMCVEKEKSLRGVCWV